VGQTRPLPGLCEPSGAAVDVEGHIWIADDDQDDRLFRWAPGFGSVTPVTLPQLGKKSILQDMEGLTWQGTTLWVLGSHSLNRKGKLKRRAQLLGWSAPRDSGPHTLHSLWPDDSTAIPEPVANAALSGCPDCVARSEWRQLNIEGVTMAPDGSTLFLGLRAPLTAAGDALVLAVGTGPATVPPIERFYTLQLGRRGVRALTPHPTRSSYWVVAGPPEDADRRDTGFALFEWTPGSSPTLVVRLPPLDGAPEALIPIGPTEAWLLLDEGDRLKKDLEDGNTSAHGVVDGDDVKFECGVDADLTDPTQWAHAVRVTWQPLSPSDAPPR
jgi:hypothetical protein